MNRIERILEKVEKKLTEYPEDKLWVQTYGQQVEFFKWLLEDVNGPPTYELHQLNVDPTVWGMGDVSYHIRIQLRKIKTPTPQHRADPIVLVFDYQPLESGENR